MFLVCRGSHEGPKESKYQSALTNALHDTTREEVMSATAPRTAAVRGWSWSRECRIAGASFADCGPDYDRVAYLGILAARLRDLGVCRAAPHCAAASAALQRYM